MNQVQKIIRAYKTASWVRAGCMILLLALCAVMLHLWCPPDVGPYAMVLAILISLGINNIAARMIATRMLCAPLYRDLDAETYYAICQDRTVAGPGMRAMAAFYYGDDAMVFNLYTAACKQPRFKAPACASWLACLMQMQFVRRDVAGLADSVAQMEQLLADPKYGKRLKKLCTVMPFYRAYLSGDYGAALQHCNEALARKDTQLPARLMTATVRLRRAMVLEAMQEKEQAEQAYQSIAVDYPKLHYATLAKERLAVLAGEPEREVEPLTAQEEYGLHDPVVAKRIRRIGVMRKIIWIMALWMLLIAAVEFLLPLLFG